MIDYSKRLPLNYALNRMIDKGVDNALESQGQSLPCEVIAVNGPFVTVRFLMAASTNDNTTVYTLPDVTMPVIGSEYIRVPLRARVRDVPGTRGIALSCSVGIGAASGTNDQTYLGPSPLPMFNEPGNLSAMVFIPIGNMEWKLFPADTMALYADFLGALIEISHDAVTVNVGYTYDPDTNTRTGGTVFKVDSSGVSIVGNLSITGAITATGDITGNGTSLHTHEHGGVQTGSGNTGAPI